MMIGLFLHLSFISHFLSSNIISAFHFILSLTYVEEIMGELSSDSDSDESVQEVSPLGRQRQPPPQQEPRHQREESFSDALYSHLGVPIVCLLLHYLSGGE